MGPGVEGKLSSARVQKPVRWGWVGPLATEKRRLWAAGCWFIYSRVPRAIKAPSWDQETIYTAGWKGARDWVLYSPLPRMRRGGASWVLQP